jgi:hypothetical protein
MDFFVKGNLNACVADSVNADASMETSCLVRQRDLH